MKFREFRGRSTAFRERGRLCLTLAAAALVTAAPALPARADSAAMTRIAAPSVQWASPALWVVEQGDSKAYLFGTFHALDPRMAWNGGRVRAALQQSDALILETVIPTDKAELRAAGKRATDGKPQDFVKATGRTIASVKRSGMSVDQGADAVLRRLAEAAGKPVDGLETFEEQLATLASIPAAPPASAVAAVPAKPSITMSDLLSAWRAGDDSAFTTMLQGFEEKSPTAYRMLIANRNARWEERVEAMLAQPGTRFVAVGAGHLAGKDSLIALLRAKGYKVRRVG